MSKKMFNVIEKLGFIVLLTLVMGVKGFSLMTSMLIGLAWGLLSSILEDKLVDDERE